MDFVYEYVIYQKTPYLFRSLLIHIKKIKEKNDMNKKGFSKEGREEWYKTMVIYRFMANYNLEGDMEKSSACFDL